MKIQSIIAIALFVVSATYGCSTNDELKCDGCRRIVRCVERPNGRFYRVLNERCRFRSYCLTGEDGTPSCSNDPNPFCDGTARMLFRCPGAGLYPDPFYCNRFVRCRRTSRFGLKIRCRRGWAYNSETQRCDISTSSDEAKEICNDNNNVFPVPLCTENGQNGSLKNDNTTYFVCVLRAGRLYPQMYKCPVGSQYDENQGECAAVTTTTEANTGTTSETSTETTIEPTAEPTIEPTTVARAIQDDEDLVDENAIIDSVENNAEEEGELEEED